MFILAFQAVAQAALVCAPPLDTATCEAVNEMQVAINDQLDPDVVLDNGPARLRPAFLYNRLVAVRATAEAASCQIDGWTGGAYFRSEEWSGTFADTADTGSVLGTHSRSAGTFEGDYVPDTSAPGTFGDVFAGFNKQGQLGSNRDDGFMMGWWSRTQGTNGIWMALHGSCDPGVEPRDAFEGWYAGSFTDVAPSTTLVTIHGTADNVYTLFVDGVQQAFDPNWPTVTSTPLVLSSGDHQIAVRAQDQGPPAMFILRVDGPSETLLTTTDLASWRTIAAGTPEPTDWTLASFDDSAWNVPTNCGANGTSPWGNRIPGANYIWNGPCGSGTALFRATLTVP